MNIAKKHSISIAIILIIPPVPIYKHVKHSIINKVTVPFDKNIGVIFLVPIKSIDNMQINRLGCISEYTWIIDKLELGNYEHYVKTNVKSEKLNGRIPIITIDDLRCRVKLFTMNELNSIKELNFPSWSTNRNGIMDGLELKSYRNNRTRKNMIEIVGQSKNSGVTLIYSINDNMIINPKLRLFDRRTSIITLFYASIFSISSSIILVLIYCFIIKYFKSHKKIHCQS